MKGQRKKKRFTKKQVLRAIEGSRGIMLVVAQRLGCGWDTARRFVSEWEETRRAFEEEREKLLDDAESLVAKQIAEGDTQVALWVLSRLGRKRGWGDKVEIEQGTVNIVLRFGDATDSRRNAASAARWAENGTE